MIRGQHPLSKHIIPISTKNVWIFTLQIIKTIKSYKFRFSKFNTKLMKRFPVFGASGILRAIKL